MLRDKGYNPDDNLYYNILEHYTKTNKDQNGDTNASTDQTKVDSVHDGEYR